MTFQKEVRRRGPGGRRAWWLVALPVLAQRGPAPASVNLPPEVLALACAPSWRSRRRRRRCASPAARTRSCAASSRPATSSRSTPARDNGIEVGQEFFMRRAGPDRAARHQPRQAGDDQDAAGSASTPWTTRCRWPRSRTRATRIELTTTSSRSSCPTVPAVSATGRRRSATTTAACCRAPTAARCFGRGDFFIVDRGSDHGVTPGAQFVVYRDKRQPRISCSSWARRWRWT